MKTSVLAALLGAIAIGCASPQRPTPAPPTRRTRPRAEEPHVIASPDGRGEAYDAAMLFSRANDRIRAGDCVGAVVEFDRLEREFPASSAVASSRFNRGVCLQRLGRFGRRRGGVRARRACEGLVSGARRAVPPGRRG